jgi:spermidine/putrescine transport system substrate-binding protein
MNARPQPTDPRVAALVNYAMSAKLTRRTLLAGAGAGAVALGLAACAPAGTTSLTPAADLSSKENTLRWATWPFYMDVDDATGKRPTLEAFQSQTGMAVTYDEAISSNEDFYAVIKDQLKLGKDVGYDIVTLTDYFAARMVRLGVMQPIDMKAMPNVAANLNPALRDVTFDPGRLYSLPWQTGMTGLGWSKEYFPNGLTTIEELWDPKLKGKIVLLNQWVDVMSLVMMSQGVDISGNWGQTEFDAALAVIEEQVAKGQIRAFTGNEYSESFASGDVVAGTVWSGDIFGMNSEAGSEKYGFALPKTGGFLWSDNFMIPMGASHKANAQKLIDYYYDPEVAAQVAAYVCYITPVVGAQEAMKSIDPELAQSPLIFPTAATLAQAHGMRQLTPEEEVSFAKAYEKVQAG